MERLMARLEAPSMDFPTGSHCHVPSPRLRRGGSGWGACVTRCPAEMQLVRALRYGSVPPPLTPPLRKRGEGNGACAGSFGAFRPMGVSFLAAAFTSHRRDETAAPSALATISDLRSIVP